MLCNITSCHARTRKTSSCSHVGAEIASGFDLAIDRMIIDINLILIVAHRLQDPLHLRILLHLLPQLNVPFRRIIKPFILQINSNCSLRPPPTSPSSLPAIKNVITPKFELFPCRPPGQASNNASPLRSLITQLQDHQQRKHQEQRRPPAGIAAKGRREAVSYGIGGDISTICGGEKAIPCPPAPDGDGRGADDEGGLIVRFENSMRRSVTIAINNRVTRYM
jgi:hypothetical protein